MAGPRTLRLFPLSTVLFPGATLNLHVFEPRYRQMIAECLASNEPFGVILIREGDEAGDPEVQPYEIGTVAEIAEVSALPSGRYYLRCLGRERFRLLDVISREPFLCANVEFLGEDIGNERATFGLIETLAREYRDYVHMIGQFSGATIADDVPEDPIVASFIIADALQVSDGVKQRMLEQTTAFERLETEMMLLRRLVPQLRSLIDRKRQRQTELRYTEPSNGGEFRARQEAFFGKYFSQN
jgi:hypothetical protein